MGLVLGGLGLAGLAGYIYLDRNPSAKAAIEADKKAAIERIESVTHGAKASLKERTDSAKASANELIGRAVDKVEEKKDAVKSLGNEKAASGEAGLAIIGALIKDSWTDFKLEKVEPYNHNTAIYTFSFPSEDATAGGNVASALLVRSSDAKELLDDKGKPVIRPYTAITGPETKGHLKLMVKEYPTGKMSKHIADLKIGDTLAFKGPIQKFPYKANEFDHGVCVSGGSGITPMYQLITHAMDLKDDKTKFTLIFSNVTDKDILLRKEWDELVKANPDRLKVVYALDKAPYFWKGETGFITKDIISKYAPKADGAEKVKIFVCGPPGQVKSVSGPKDGPRQGEVGGILKELSYNADQVFKF